MKKNFFLLASSALLVAALSSCGSSASASTGVLSSEEPSANGYSMDFSKQSKGWEKKTNAKFGVNYYTASAIYCENPTNPGNQTLTLYVPEAYIKEDGTIDKAAKVGSFTSDSAPIVYWNSHGSYVGMGPFTINGNSTRTTQYGWALNLIKNGVVVCMVGERGKTTVNDKGEVIGRGPIAVSDLKAGVRFLKRNDDVIPGSSKRIVSVGTSSGGATSALLGASGNSPYYEKYLKEMGAIMDETDDVFATQAYCPITDLDHADFAYEWMFGADDEALTPFQKRLSQEYRKEYVSYINSLGLKGGNNEALTLNEDGRSGGYYDYLLGKFEESFEHYVENYETDYKGYSTEKGNGVEFVDTHSFITYDAGAKKAHMVTPDGEESAIDALVKQYRPRQKTCPSFDSLAPEGTDNDVFGPQGPKAGSREGARHFNQRAAEIMDSLREEFPTEVEQYYQSYYDESHVEEVEEWVTYLNSYSFLTGKATSNVSPHFRVNMGAHDADTSISVSATLALLLEKNGIDAEFNILWDWGHNDVDTPTGLLNWIESICQ